MPFAVCPGGGGAELLPAGILAENGLRPEISNWLVTALKQSANDHREFTETQVDSLVGRMKDLRRRLDLIQMDRIDGRITEKRYENRKQGLEKDETEVAAKVERLDHADFHFKDKGVVLHELVQMAVILGMTMIGARSASCWRQCARTASGTTSG
jgi:hypothetical protein